MDGTALIFCEGAFSTPTGKTANGLVRFTERYLVRGVIDSLCAGRDAGEALDGRPCGVPIFAALEDAIGALPEKPLYFVIGIAPDGGRLPDAARPAVAHALRLGINVDSGLHTFLGDDPEFKSAAQDGGATIRDVRRPPSREHLHFWTGKIMEVRALKVALLGTDSAIGKRTTAILLNRALLEAGVKSTIVGTGQTAWMQGVPHCIVMDSIVNDFVTGELEHIVWQAWNDLHPEAILIEGQGCLTHPAYPGGFEILAACRPDAIILQHSPMREYYDGFPGLRLAGIEREMAILRELTPAPIIAIALNHEKMTPAEVEKTADEYERRYGIPGCDPLLQGCGKLVSVVKGRLPAEGNKNQIP